MFGEVCKSDGAERLVNLTVGDNEVSEPCGNAHIFPGAQIVLDAVHVADIDEIAVKVFPELCDGLALIENFAGVGNHKPRQKPQKACFTGAVCAGKAHKRARRRFKREPPEKQSLTALELKTADTEPVARNSRI